MTSFFTADDGARIAYTDSGAGRPLLCLAGLTRTGRDFDYVAAHLPGIRLICMDYRGRGDSAWTGADSYTVPREAQDAVQLLAHLGIARAPILGTSRGGLIGMALAATLPGLVAGLCLNDIGPKIEDAGLARIKDYVGLNPPWPDVAAAIDALAKGSIGFSDVPEGRWAADLSRHFTALPEGGFKINYDPALRDAVLAAFEAPMPDAWPLWDQIAADLPVAVIRGAGSDLLSAETVAEMARRRPGLITAEVPGRGHVPWLDEPEALSAIHAVLDACP